MNFLACDLGGTKVLIGIYEKGNNNESPKLILKKKIFIFGVGFFWFNNWKLFKEGV